MGKSRKTLFFCAECGGESPVWAGRCPHCGSWNTMTEETAVPGGSSISGGAAVRTEAVPLSKVVLEEGIRLSTGFGEFDRVLGGGAFRGSLILIGGEPGIGKSTLLLQSAMRMAEAGSAVLYASGEESLQQVAGRAARVGLPSPDLSLLPSSNLACIESHLARGAYDALVVDSIQTMHSEELSSPSGSVSQVRHCAARLGLIARPSGTTVFMVGHVTKDGAMAGPKVLEHLVDAVISFQGDSFHQYRLLRGVKNRFGSTSELGVFEMKAKGLEEVSDSAGYFLEGKDDTVTGSAVAAVMEGSRPFLVEVQALAITSGYGFPQRRANGLDSARLAMLLAVLERRCGLQLCNQDVYVNVAGGLSVSDPGADLAVCLAIASSLLDRPVIPSTAMAGEVGLSGEVRPVAGVDRRIAEAVNLGFTQMACARVKKNEPPAALIEFDTVSSAVSRLLREKGGECST